MVESLVKQHMPKKDRKRAWYWWGGGSAVDDKPATDAQTALKKVSQDFCLFRICIKLGSCVFQCDIPHQWIAQRQVGPVSVYCEGMECHVLRLRHGIQVWQDIGQSTTATSRLRRDMTSNV